MAMSAILLNGTIASASGQRHGSYSHDRCDRHDDDDDGHCSRWSCHDRCRSDSQCDDNEVCKFGRCFKLPRGFCKKDSHCGPNQECRWFRCQPKPECRQDSECGEGKECRQGECKDRPECRYDSECGAGKQCRNNHCEDRPECTCDADCGAGRECVDGECQDRPECSCDADCDAGEVCRDGKCEDGPCQSEADCLPGQICLDGECRPGPEPCTPTREICDDGIDNDCDGIIDATDSDCASPPPAEICGDCADNDGNGLTDFEDPACCGAGASYALNLSRGRIVPKGATSKLKLRTTFAGAAQSINPLQQDVYLQLRPANGRDVLCAMAPAAKFMRMGKRTFKFWAGKTVVPSTRGIHDMKIKIRRDGSVVYKAFGKKVALSGMQRGPLQVTVGFMNRSSGQTVCSLTTANFQANKGAALIAR
jgi:hypothetical protein